MSTIGPAYRSDFIEKMKEQLHMLVQRKGSLTDPEVLALSQELDRCILAVQHSISCEISA